MTLPILEIKKEKASENAFISYDEQKKTFIITRDILGNQIDVERLLSHVIRRFRLNLKKAFWWEKLNSSLEQRIMCSQRSKLQKKCSSSLTV